MSGDERDATRNVVPHAEPRGSASFGMREHHCHRLGIRAAARRRGEDSLGQHHRAAADGLGEYLATLVGGYEQTLRRQTDVRQLGEGRFKQRFLTPREWTSLGEQSDGERFSSRAAQPSRCGDGHDHSRGCDVGW